ncbi:MAG: M23 family metallopeptidase [Gammaproteobacteria bacterium]|nr:M23 family metallopeptidase [Gammaproteobacteria bacterium]
MKRDLQREIEPVGWPTKGGWVSSSYGYRRDPFTGQKTFHRGVDIANHPNAEIKAIAAGIATVIRDDPGYGLLLEVNHGGGYATRYAHLMESKVHVGERVEKGQVIGVVGSTGRSTGAHLHFEVLKEGKAVNPREYLKTTS